MNQPSLTRRILDLDHDTTNVLVGMIASHFATAADLSHGEMERYVDEAQAVSGTHRYTYPSGGAA